MAGKPRNRNRSTARATVAAPTLLTQVITMLMHAPIAEARHVIEVGAAIVLARGAGSSTLTQPALPGTTAASSPGYSTTASGAPRRKPGPKPKPAAGEAVAADAVDGSANQPVNAATPAKGPRRVPPANKLPGAGTRPAVAAGGDAVAGGAGEAQPALDGLPAGDAPLPDQGAADDVEPVAEVVG